MVNVLIADDHRIICAGVRVILESDPRIKVVGEAYSGQEAVRLAADYCPDAIILDVHMPGFDGIRACREIIKIRPAANILMISSLDRQCDVFASLEAGAKGYVLKNLDSADLIKAVHVLASGESFFDPVIASKIAGRFSGKSVDRRTKEAALDDLSCRETEVLRSMEHGCSNAAIAKELYISTSTVKTHVSNILRKLAVDDRTQAAIKAYKDGLV